jgi:hypothetical protein
MINRFDWHCGSDWLAGGGGYSGSNAAPVRNSRW